MADALSLGKPFPAAPKSFFAGDIRGGNTGGLIGILKAGLIQCNPHINWVC